ncbi:hypothetical protein [Nitrospira sp. Nam80]
MVLATACVVLIAGTLFSYAGPSDPPAVPAPLSQVTKASGCGYFVPQISADGRWLLAMTDCMQPGSSYGRQTVRIDRATQRVERLTPPEANPEAATISSDGNRIVFLSDAELVSGENPDRIQQLFLYDAVEGRYTQLSRLRADMPGRALLTPQISASGQVVVVASDADLVPGENTDGNMELFLIDLRAHRVLQLTHTATPANHQWPAMDQDSRTVVFVGVHLMPDGETTRSDRDGLYAWDRQSGEVRILLESPVGMATVFSRPVLAAYGQALVFHSQADFLGENPDQNDELFLVEMATGILTQLTHTSRCMNVLPDIAADGTWVTFLSTCRYHPVQTTVGANVFLLHVGSDDVLPLTRTGSMTVGFHPPSIDAAGRTAAFSVNAELPGMINPRHDLQIVTTTVPARKGGGLPPPRRVLRPEDISAWAISRDDPNVLYLGTRTSGVLRSRDGGRSWQLASYRLGEENITGLVAGRAEPNLLYASTAHAGVYRSVDGGQHWMDVNDGLKDLCITGLALELQDHETLYAQTPSGVFRSGLLVEQWEPVSQLPRGLVAGQPSDGGVQLAYAIHASEGSQPKILAPSEKAVQSVLQKSKGCSTRTGGDES